jgi:uncharacterized membrane protein
MKKSALILVFSLLCTYLYADKELNTEPNIDIQLVSSKNIISNEREFHNFFVTNRDRSAFYDLELTVTNDANLEIILDKNKIAKLEPNDKIKVDMEIINNYKYYFDKDIFITIKISNDEYTKSDRRRFTIKPVENFWFFTILSIALIIIVLFVLIFIKINQGEENVR